MKHKQAIKKVLLIAFFLNIAVAVAKLVYGLYTNTLSMVGDGVHSFIDGWVSLLGIVSIEYASRPSDHDHHYGHSKYETLASLGIAAFICLTSWEILKKGISRFMNPAESEFHIAGIIIILATIVINYFVASYERKKADELESAILKSDSLHTSSDMLVSISVLISLIAIKFQIQWVDTMISILIALYLGYTAYLLILENFMVLTDAAFIDVQAVKKIALKESGVISCHRIRTRGTPSHSYVDLHIQVAPETTTIHAHRIAHRIEEKIMNEIPGIIEVMIHTEPFPDDDEELATDKA